MAANPFIEPCPGCFETRLRELSEMPGNPVFLGNGDFGVARLLEALAKLAHGADLILSAYCLEQATVDRAAALVRKGSLQSATLVCEFSPEPLRCPKGIALTRHPMRLNALLLRRPDGTHLSVIGNISPDNSHALEAFTLVNDPDTQHALWRQLSFMAKPH